jgi:hypothetical protein
MGWAFTAVFVAGWVLASRIAMRSLMGRLKCPEGSEFLDICREYHSRKHKPVPVGELRERHLGDVLLAALIGLAWPVVLAAQVVAGMTPATPGELRRVSREQQATIEQQARDIEALTRQMKGGL